MASYYKNVLKARQSTPYGGRGLSNLALGGAALAGGAAYYYNKYRGQPVVPQKVAAGLTSRQKKAIKKRGGIVPKSKPSLKKQVTELKKQVNASNGTLIYRARQTFRALAAVNQQTHIMTENIAMANLEVVLAELRFFNPAVPGTLTQGSGASGTYTREYMFKSIATNVTIRNNYQVPAKVTYYIVAPKEDTSIAPLTSFTNGLTDVGAPSSSSQLVHLTDSDEFNDLYRIVSSKSKVLLPGMQMHALHSVKDILYSPATYDSHSLSYQKKYGSYMILVRVEGVIAHDSSADQQGLAQAGVDVLADTTYRVIYDAGIDLKYIVVNDASDSFTNGALVSSMPVADNIPYSVS